MGKSLISLCDIVKMGFKDQGHEPQLTRLRLKPSCYWWKWKIGPRDSGPLIWEVLSKENVRY